MELVDKTFAKWEVLKTLSMCLETTPSSAELAEHSTAILKWYQLI